MAKGGSRHELTLAVIARKEEIWNKEDRKYNDRRSVENVVYGVGQNGPPSMALLQWAANASDEDLQRVIGSNPKYSFLFYK